MRQVERRSGRLACLVMNSTDMGNFSFASMALLVLSFIATLFLHFLFILQLLRLARVHLHLWMLSGRLEFSIGVLILSLEFRPDTWGAQQQNLCGVDVNQSVSTGLWNVFEALARGCGA